MKTINLVDDLEKFHKFFSEVKSQSDQVIVWQLDPSTQKRTIFNSIISDVADENTTLSLNTVGDEAYMFNSDAVYFYVESRMSIFKAEQVSIQNNFLAVKYPEELKMLDEMEDDKLKAVFNAIDPNYVKEPPTYHDVSESKDKGYTFVSGEGRANQENPDWQVASGGGRKEKMETMWKGAINAHNDQSEHDKQLFEEELSFVTLDEEDKKYEGQRTAPRARPPEGKMIILQTFDGQKPQETLPLFDLSRGGMGFMVFSKDAYFQGEVLNVFGFDTKKFDEPMFAIVRSVREADEMGIQYKIGCQFIDALKAEEEAAKAAAP